MKVSRLFSAATLTFAMALTSVNLSHAADPVAPAPVPSKPARIMVLESELGLSPEQKTSIAPVIEARKAALTKMRADKMLDAAAKTAATKEIMAKYGNEIRSHLSPVQKNRYAALIKKESTGGLSRLEVLMAELNLSAEQQVAIAPLLGARKNAVSMAREENAEEAPRKAAVAAVMKDYGAKIRAVLTPEQKDAYAALLKREAMKS